MKKLKNINGFTFIELIISITIVIILSALGFSSYSEHLENSRDGQRKADLSGVGTALKLHLTKRGSLPTPGSSFNLLNNGFTSATQGKLDDTLVISTIDKIPKDPFVNTPYIYSITRNKQEFQLATTLENNGKNVAFINGNYKSVSKNILPTLILAMSLTSNTEIKDGVGAGSTNRTKFVFDNGSHNLPYTFDSPYLPYSDGTVFNSLLSDPNIKWWQNSDYRSCNEIVDSGKNIGAGEYQISNGTTLSNVTCSNVLIPASCKEIKMNNPSAVDGAYTILPNGVATAFNVRCDMTTDGGGWTLVLLGTDSDIGTYDSRGTSQWINGSSYIAYSNTNSSFKYDDTLINNIRGNGIYRISATATNAARTSSYYVPNTCIYDHDIGSNGDCGKLYSDVSLNNNVCNNANGGRKGIGCRSGSDGIITNHGVTTNIVCFQKAGVGGRCTNNGENITVKLFVR